MDREVKKIQAEEVKLQKETKTQAAKGNVSSVQMLAKQIVKTRAAVRRLERTKASMHAVNLQLATSVATMATTGSLRISADAMRKMNAIAGTAEVSSALADMRRQMETTADIEGQMDEALMESEEEEEASAEVQKVLEEMALGHIGTLSQSTAPADAAPLAPAAFAQPQAAVHQQAPRRVIGELSAPPAKRIRVDPPQQQQLPPAAVVPVVASGSTSSAAPPLQSEAHSQTLLASKDVEIEQLRARLALAERAVGVAVAASGQVTAAVETASAAVGAASAVAGSLTTHALAQAATQSPPPQMEAAPPELRRAATDLELERRIAALRR